MHSLNLTQETLKLLMEVKRVLKSDYNISVHLASEDLADQLTKAISRSHDENLYNLACRLWDELTRDNPNPPTQDELQGQREFLEQAWQHSDNATVH